MSPITTHVLDTARGQPGEGIAVVLEHHESDGSWRELARDQTNADGRITTWLPDSKDLTSGVYRLRFATAAYFAALGMRCFYPEVIVVFSIDDSAGHYHVPLLLSPFGYTTYRGT